ncbi:hypothetical protein cyc_01485 [Cyclospora cayetanensis]|uniref:PRA1 family protein n=1 Tax=Cyclospora cayetanensis TaxID=88456 RepID=A0A1D3D6Y3_9EIME|nr:hypothetical protein cyc_01485 [Cyclospora cayetanensis]
MMLDTAGGAAGGDQLSASVIDDFYASDAPDQHVFSGPVSPSASFNNEAVTQSHPPDELTHATHPAASPATVSLGGNTPDSVGLGGSLDGNKIPGGAKFAVSQIHGVYLALHRSVLSRCAPWSEFAMTSSFQRPGTGAAAVDRMERNMRYFATNYLCICGALGPVGDGVVWEYLKIRGGWELELSDDMKGPYLVPLSALSLGGQRMGCSLNPLTPSENWPCSRHLLFLLCRKQRSPIKRCTPLARQPAFEWCSAKSRHPVMPSLRKIAESITQRQAEAPG